MKLYFFESAKQMILQWYFQEDCQATSKTITNIYHPNKKSSPYNGIVKKLSNKILEFLDYRFWVESASSVDSESFWCIPFDGCHINYDSSKNFIRKIRDELIQALDELPSFVEGFINHDVKEYESYDNAINSHLEGEKVVRYSTLYSNLNNIKAVTK